MRWPVLTSPRRCAPRSSGWCRPKAESSRHPPPEAPTADAARSQPLHVMAGLGPAIHVLLTAFKKDVDARDKRGHDGGEVVRAVPHALLRFTMSYSHAKSAAALGRR